MSEDTVVCPTCHGRGEQYGIACGPGACRSGKVPCRTCWGAKVIDGELMRAIEKGMRMRGERIAEGRSQRDEAMRLGMTVQEYSRLEHPHAYGETP